MVTLTQEQVDYARTKEFRKALLESVVEIEDKDRQVVPFILNDIQCMMFEESTARDVYVKPSQVGATTLFMADFLLDCITKPGTTSVIISYDEFITGRLLRKADAIYLHLHNKIPNIPEYKHKSTFEKTFEFVDKLGVRQGESSFYISSAKGFAMPRGEPIHNLLLDELAFWPAGAAAKAFAAALQRVPLRADTKVRALSTPNGEDNDFFELYMAAKEGKEFGKSVFKAHFYPWYIHAEYSLTQDSPFAPLGDDHYLLTNLTSEETTLLTRFEQLGTSELEAHNKLRWRRYKIMEMMSLKRSGDTALLFGQEYPEDDVTCFQVAGDQWYDPDQVNALAKECFEAPIHRDFMDIWEMPEEGERYLVTVDPGEGKKSMSVACAWKPLGVKLKHCATLAGLYNQKEMGEKVKAFASFYNEAKLAPEDALGFIGYISDYPELYYRTDPDTGQVSTKYVGWLTTPKTKPYMCNEVARLLPDLECNDIRIIEQLRNIKEIQSGMRKIPASIGADDFFMALALAAVCRESEPIGRGFVGAKGWSDTWGSR